MGKNGNLMGNKEKMGNLGKTMCWETTKNSYLFTVLVTVLVTVQKLSKRYRKLCFLLLITFLPLSIKKEESNNIDIKKGVF